MVTTAAVHGLIYNLLLPAEKCYDSIWPTIGYYGFPMTLEKFEHNFYAALARNEILSRRGSSFQDFFVAVGHHCWAPDFEGRRPQGRIGDKKCDGYRPSGAVVYQCYAPREMRPGLLSQKIDEDFRGALKNREHTPIRRWILVHNDFEELRPKRTN